MTTNQEIYIRLLEESDAEQSLRLEVDNKDFFQLYTPLRDERHYTLEGQLERLIENRKKAEDGSGFYFGIFHKESQRLIGNVTLSEVTRGPLQSCWIGYYLDKDHNGKGYTTVAVKWAVDFAFEELKLHRIEAGVMPHNLGSIKVLEKAGFHKEGIAKENVEINGKWEDHQILAIINRQ